MSAIYYDSCGHRGYIFDPSDSSWAKIGATRLNDSMVIIGRDTINISGAGGGSDNSIATGARTATGDYIQNWADHWFYLNNLKSLSLKSNRPDPNLPLNNKVFNLYADSTYNSTALQLAWGLKDQSNSATDSLHFEINSNKDYTYLTHWVAKQQKYVELDLNPNQTYPGIQMYASGSSKDGFYILGANTAVLNPQDSVRLRAPSGTGSKMLALANISSGIGTVVAMDIPTGGGSADSTTFATKYGVDTAKVAIRGEIAAKVSGINQLTNDVTAGPGTGSQAATIATNAVTNSKFRQSSALSIVGRWLNSAGNVADISATLDSSVLSRIGDTLAFRKIDSSLLKKTGVTPGSYTLATITIGKDGRVYAASNGSVGGIPTLDAVVLAGGIAYNNDVFLIRNSGGQQVLQVENDDTTSDATVARVNIVAQRGKTALCFAGSDSADEDMQWFDRDRVPGTWKLTDSVAIKRWVLSRVGRNPSNPTSLWRGISLVNVAGGNARVANWDTLGRMGLMNVTDPKAYLDIPSGAYPGMRMRPEAGGTPHANAGDIHNTGNQITFTDFSGGVHNLVDQIGDVADGSITGSGPYTFNPAFHFNGDANSGISYWGTVASPVISSNSSTHSSAAFWNNNSSGNVGFELFSNDGVLRGLLGVNNGATSRFNIMGNTGTSIDFRAGGAADNDPTMRLTSSEGVYMKTLVGSGTRIVTTDASGNLAAGQAVTATPTISTGTTAPATTPAKVGDIYVDTSNKKLYFATGTSSSADWTIAN